MEATSVNGISVVPGSSGVPGFSEDSVNSAVTVTFDDGIDLLNEKDARVYRQSVPHNATASLGAAVDLWLTLDDKIVEQNSAASDKVDKEQAAPRLQEEQERQDSLEQAERNDVVRALHESGSLHDNVTETDEDEFF